MTPLEAENKINAALWKARCASAILGNPRTRDFELVDLDGPPLSAEMDADFRQRGFFILGVIAVGEDGGPRSALFEYEGFDGETISALTVKFLKQYQDKLLAKALMRLRAPNGLEN